MHVTTISGKIRSTSADGGSKGFICDNMVATFYFFTHFDIFNKNTKKIYQFLSPFLKGLTPKLGEAPPPITLMNHRRFGGKNLLH
jgi:hypothetical protein